MTRQMFIPFLVLAATALAVSSADAQRREKVSGQKLMIFIGTYTGGGSKGIYRCEFDLKTGRLSEPVLAAETVNPSFLAFHPSNRFLYAVNEIDNFNGEKAGAVSAFTLNPKTGGLKALNQVSSVGTIPCHIAIDNLGRHALVANYGTGSTTVIAIQKDGTLGKTTAFVQHKGMGGDPKRQKGPHAHCVQLDAKNRFALVADLGLDKVLVYRYGKDGTLTPNDPPALKLAPAAGPRHFAFHPTKPWVYVINEMDSTVTAATYDAKKGELTKGSTLSTLPVGFKGRNSTAEILVHPTGKFVYGSNRGHDSIAVFYVDQKTGSLKHIGNQGKGIKTPRNFRIDPTGKYLLVANQGSNNIVVFRIDAKTGRLTPHGTGAMVVRPVCLRMMTPE